MARPRLLILDTCTIIELHEIGLWNAVLASFQVTVTETVRDEASHCQIDGEMVPIQLGEAVNVVAVSPKVIAEFRALFSPSYIAALHPGESDSLVFLLQSEDFVICSSDAIVFKVLGCLNEGDRCISLEVLLSSAGMGRTMWSSGCTEGFRQDYLQQGWADKLQGRALKK